jgi:hypothetical protein
MNLKRASLALVAPVTALLAVATPAVSASAAPVAAHTTKVPCRAWMSTSTPKDYSTIDVWVATNAHAEVATAAHYRTTTTKHSAWANAKGDAEIAYRISGATPGYKVKVAVTVASGRNWGSCSTSFTPHR